MAIRSVRHASIIANPAPGPYDTVYQFPPKQIFLWLKQVCKRQQRYA